MSDAKSIADTRLAKGEISAEEHARIAAAIQSGNPSAPPEGAKGARPDNTISPQLAGVGLASSVAIFIAIRSTQVRLSENGEPVNWAVVYGIYAFCAFGFVTAALALLANRKK